jgi:uncharacterized short protein YbdD (DUF466 family)
MNTAAASRWSRWWGALRTLSGDDRYERYVEHLRTHHPGTKPPSRSRFYASELERRWNRDGPTRCC